MAREHIVDRLVELGCDDIQIGALNYAQWHIDPGNRRAFEAKLRLVGDTARRVWG